MPRNWCVTRDLERIQPGRCWFGMAREPVKPTKPPTEEPGKPYPVEKPPEPHPNEDRPLNDPVPPDQDLPRM